MITHSGTSYTPMGNPNSGGNPTNPPSPSPLEYMMREMMRDMHTQFDAMENKFNELRTETNRHLNTLEQL